MHEYRKGRRLSVLGVALRWGFFFKVDGLGEGSDGVLIMECGGVRADLGRAV